MNNLRENKRSTMRSPIRTSTIGLAIFSLGASVVLLQVKAQTATASPRFEVATVKPKDLFADPGAQPNGGYRVGVRSDRAHGLFACDYCSLQLMLLYAYGLKADQLVGPAWISMDSYHVEARMAPGASSQDILQMMQALLNDKFALQVHRERKTLAVYSLVAASQKLKLEKADKAVLRYANVAGEMNYEGIDMKEFAHQISARIGVRVVDRTGLDGPYKIKMKWENANSDGGPGSEISSALKEQTGLILKPEKIDTELLIVDHANRLPSNN